MRLYNTLTKEKEDFQPLVPGQVGMYVCGPTVYDRVHIGNARPYVIFDILYRLLKRHYKTTYVRNITDVDDKINKRAHELGLPISEITEKTIAFFREDIAKLNTLPPDVEPLATEHISEMIEMITLLIEKGHAYCRDGHVLFRVASLESYGKLSRRNRDEMLAGARVEVAPYKEDPGDFVLWKPSDETTPGWESPWGYGRPGWHIECSAMSSKYLGPTFDIHAGGRDLIFPHHENEMAQSWGCCGEGTFAKYWLHNGMITVGGEKMSKSLGNFITIQDALTQAHGETIRYLLLSAHYRQALDWTADMLAQAKQTLDRFYTCLRGLEGLEPGEIAPEVLEALEDDLNTPLAFSKMHELATQINKREDVQEKRELCAVLLGTAQFMGLLLENPETWFKGASETKDGLSDEAIEALIEERLEARKNKDFARADQVRNQLQEAGILLEDTPTGTQWRR